VEQQPLFFEDVYAALKYVVQSLGKPKDVGPLIFPHKEDPFAAGRLLSDCINPNRDSKLDIEQVILLLRLAREKGCHLGIEYLCTAAGYTKPTPVEPNDERAALQRQFIQSVTELRQLANRITAGQ
jgi:hypothetical protein